jgi:hypothetical protein
MLRFSLSQIFLAVVALAFGFSIWRLPKGNWVDIPLAALSFIFALSLCRQALSVWRVRATQSELPRNERWGSRILVVELLGTALALIVAFVCTALAAAEVPTHPSQTIDPDPLGYALYPQLPRDLAALALLLAIGRADSWNSPSRSGSRRQNVYAALAAGGTLIAMLAYWADRLLIWFLVYLAIAGVEAAEPPAWRPPELDRNSAVSVHRFVLGSLAGLPLLVASPLLIAGVVRWWRRRPWRLVLLVSLAASLAGEFWLLGWLANQGLRRLSPTYLESMHVPPLPVCIVVASMVVLAAAAFAWRAMARAAPANCPLDASQRTLLLHESWLGSLLLGLLALACIVNTTIGSVIASLNSPVSSKTVELQDIVYSLTYRPAQFIWLAAASGGFALAWSRWRHRREPLRNTLPSIDPAIFAVTMLGLMLVAIASAPIVAAVSFSYWLVLLGGG